MMTGRMVRFSGVAVMAVREVAALSRWWRRSGTAQFLVTRFLSASTSRRSEALVWRSEALAWRRNEEPVWRHA
jgi:hypothetical protein